MNKWGDIMTIGKKLKQLRASYNLSIEDFAKKVNVSPSYISKLENDKVIEPSTKILNKIALACNKDISYFFETRKVNLKDYIEQAPPRVKKLLEDEKGPAYMEVIVDLWEQGLQPDEIRQIFSAIERVFFKNK